jgi:nitrite reductase/ring-hydroxylating ferredoxin subunit
MSEFTKIADATDLPPGTAIAADFKGEKVALFNVDGVIYAIADTCTHVGGPLSEGSVDGTDVTCPLHGAVFDLTTGGAKGPPAGGDVTKYEVRVEGDEIQIATG